MLLYFAYGSNLHPLRLQQRVPSAQFIAVAAYDAHCIAFEKCGMDSSGKCNLVPTGIAGDRVFGAIYTLDPEHKPLLDRFEGRGYRDRQITVHGNGRDYACFTYLAEQDHIDRGLKPFHWYQQLVVLGARYHRFPEKYISMIESFDSIEDTDTERRRKVGVLIENISKYR